MSANIQLNAKELEIKLVVKRLTFGDDRDNSGFESLSFDIGNNRVSLISETGYRFRLSLPTDGADPEHIATLYQEKISK